MGVTCSYLEYCVKKKSGHNKAIHNYLIALYARLNDESKLLNYLHSQVSLGFVNTHWRSRRSHFKCLHQEQTIEFYECPNHLLVLSVSPFQMCHPAASVDCSLWNAVWRSSHLNWLWYSQSVFIFYWQGDNLSTIRYDAKFALRVFSKLGLHEASIHVYGVSVKTK